MTTTAAQATTSEAAAGVDQGLKYALCVIAGLSCLVNICLFCFKLFSARKTTTFSYTTTSCWLHFCQCCVNFVYCTTAVGVLVLIGNYDVTGDALINGVTGHVVRPTACSVGGFFTMFGVTESLFMMAVETILLTMLVTKTFCVKTTGSEQLNKNGISTQELGDQQAYSKTSQNHPGNGYSASRAKESRKSEDGFGRQRSVALYCVLQFVQLLVWAVLCFIPFTSASLQPKDFDSRENTTKSMYFSCLPVTLQAEAGSSTGAWKYSYFLLICLTWCPMLVVFVALSVGLFLFCCNQSNSNKVSSNYNQTPEKPGYNDVATSVNNSRLSTKCLTYTTSTRLLLEVTIWTALVVVANVSYFSDGSMSRHTVLWLLGYLVCTVLMLRACVDSIIVLVELCRPDTYKRSGLASGMADNSVCRLGQCPDNIAVVASVSQGTMCPNQLCCLHRCYVIKWWDRVAGSHVTGLLKLVPADTEDQLRLWRNEINAALLLPAKHENIAQYFWSSASKHLLTSLLAVDTVSDYRLLCRQQCSDGSLHSFVESSNNEYCMSTIRRIIHQVALGVDIIHSRRIVHNNLTTYSVYITDYNSKTNSLRAVIADFEHSYHMTSSTHRRRYQAGTQLPTTVDIQSFNLLVTELVVLTSSRQRRVRCRHFQPDENQPKSFTWLSDSGLELQRILHLLDAQPCCDANQPSSRSMGTESYCPDESSVDSSNRSMCSRMTPDSQSTGTSYQSNSTATNCTCSLRVTNVRAHKRRHFYQQQSLNSSALDSISARQRHHHHRQQQAPRARSLSLHSEKSKRHHRGFPASESDQRSLPDTSRKPWFSDSESGAFKRVGKSDDGVSSGTNSTRSRSPTDEQQDSHLGLSGNQLENSRKFFSEFLRRNHLAMDVDGGPQVEVLSHKCNNCLKKPFSGSGSFVSDASTASRNSFTGAPSKTHHSELSHVMSYRSRKRRSSNTSRQNDLAGSKSAANSSTGLGAISETASVGGVGHRHGTRGPLDTWSNASCPMCFSMERTVPTAEVSHPVLRGLYFQQQQQQQQQIAHTSSRSGVTRSGTGSSSSSSSSSSTSSASASSAFSADGPRRLDVDTTDTFI